MTVAEFWQRVGAPTTSGCHPWLGAFDENGYGRLRWRGGVHSAHRVAWELARGPIPRGDGYHGTCVLHSCDNPACVNPDHLSLGTHRQNMRQREERGRGFRPGHRLDSAKAEEIRRMARGGVLRREIASHFGVSLASVRNVLAYRTYRNEAA